MSISTQQAGEPPELKAKPQNAHRLLHRCLITVQQQVWACGRIIQTDPHISPRPLQNPNTHGRGSEARHRPRAHTPEADEQSWPDLGDTITKPTGAEEPRGSAEKPPDASGFHLETEANRNGPKHERTGRRDLLT